MTNRRQLTIVIFTLGMVIPILATGGMDVPSRTPVTAVSGATDHKISTHAVERSLAAAAAGKDAVPWKTKAMASLDLTDCEIVRVEADSRAGIPTQVRFRSRGEPITLELRPHSVRAPGMKLLIDYGDGRLTLANPGPVRTFRGTVAERPGTWVTGYAGMRGVEAVVRFADGDAHELIALQPHVPDAPSDLYAWFPSNKAADASWACQLDGVAKANPNAQGAAPLGDSMCEPTGPFVALIGCDTDASFIRSFPGTTKQELAFAQAHIETNINEINAYAYELSPLDTTHEISRIVLRLEGNDLLEVKDGPGVEVILAEDIYEDITQSGALLNAVQAEWRTNQQDAEADAVVMYTNRAITAGTANNPRGAAKLNSLCGPGVCWVKKDVLPVRRLQVTAHELGHVWGAPHCDEAPCNVCATDYCPIMRSGVFCSRIEDLRFMPCSIDEILRKRSFKSCVPDLGFLPPVVTADGPPLNNGDLITFPDVLTGETSVRTLQITNRQDCTLPIQVRTTNAAGGRFAVQGAPAEIGPNATASVDLTFTSTFAGSYTGELEITTPGLFSGYRFFLELEATAVVENNLPSMPELFCPSDQGVTQQPTRVEFEWLQGDFVETYDLIISTLPACNDPIFTETGLQQLSFIPRALTLDEGKTYCWRVVANNVNGSVSSAPREFIVDSSDAAPQIQMLFENINVAHGGALNLPLDPLNKTFRLDIRNRGGVNLAIRNFSIPDDFTLTVISGAIGPLDMGSIQEGNTGTVIVSPCGTTTLELKSTLSIPDLMQTTPIMDAFSFDTTDPDHPRFEVNLCFRCEPLSCTGAPFAGCGTIDGVSGACYHFTADCGTEFAIQNVGPFQIGDRAFVGGTVDPNAEFCFPELQRAHIPNNTISECAQDVGRCCYFGITPAPLCIVTTELECRAYVASAWTFGEDCTGNPCGGNNSK